MVLGFLFLIVFSNSIYFVWNIYYFKFNGDCSIELFIFIKGWVSGFNIIS